MTTKNRTFHLFGIFCVSLFLVFLIEKYFTQRIQRPDYYQLRQATDLAERWFQLVEKEKKERGIYPDPGVTIKHGGLLGTEYSEITTTLGSLEAKETVLNPNFAALLLKLMHDAGLDSNSVIGINLSGSFPSLAISAFAAIRTLRAKAVVVSSLGASMYGANQPGATWVDIEHWLYEKGGSGIKSSLVTYGAEGDSGGGLTPEGIQTLNQSAAQYNVHIFLPNSIRDAVDHRIDLYTINKISLLLNIGGNQASLGGCPHSLIIPNGFHEKISTCSDRDRGLIMRISERGIPYIHLLNVKDLAFRYGLPLISEWTQHDGSGLYQKSSVQKLYSIIALLIIVILLYINSQL
jgi:poly-gamma-glutamate system protein